MYEAIFTLTAEEIAAALAWHGGQSSMLYAAASTGVLSLGTVRPTERDGERWTPLTDLEWKRDLCERLEAEAACDADDARVRAKRAASQQYAEDDPDELLEQAEALESIARKCRAWLDANPGVTL